MENNNLSRLIDIMIKLRDPEEGCAWDLAQTFETIAPYTIEEAYEVDDAIARKDYAELKSELGDLLFQVIFHSHLAQEQKLFSLDEVITAICEKLIRRHPHIFDQKKQLTFDEQSDAWEAQKALERNDKNLTGLLDDIPFSLPPMSRALKLTKRAARVGFDWPDVSLVLDKLDEEILELKHEISQNHHEKISNELGDVIFTLVNLARKYEIDVEDSLRKTNRKFSQRFQYIEKKLKEQNISFSDVTLEDMENMWLEAKSPRT